MKLTESRIKEIIREELEKSQQPEKTEEKTEEKPEEDTKSLTALRQFYIDLAKKIPQMRNVSPAEVQEIAEINKLMFKMIGKGEIAKYLQYAREQFGRKLGVDK